MKIIKMIIIMVILILIMMRMLMVLMMMMTFHLHPGLLNPLSKAVKALSVRRRWKAIKTHDYMSGLWWWQGLGGKTSPWPDLCVTSPTKRSPWASLIISNKDSKSLCFIISSTVSAQTCRIHSWLLWRDQGRWYRRCAQKPVRSIGQ